MPDTNSMLPSPQETEQKPLLKPLGSFHQSRRNCLVITKPCKDSDDDLPMKPNEPNSGVFYLRKSTQRRQWGRRPLIPTGTGQPSRERVRLCSGCQGDQPWGHSLWCAGSGNWCTWTKREQPRWRICLETNYPGFSKRGYNLGASERSEVRGAPIAQGADLPRLRWQGSG